MTIVSVFKAEHKVEILSIFMEHTVTIFYYITHNQVKDVIFNNLSNK